MSHCVGRGQEVADRAVGASVKVRLRLETRSFTFRECMCHLVEIERPKQASLVTFEAGETQVVLNLMPISIEPCTQTQSIGALSRFTCSVAAVS